MIDPYIFKIIMDALILFEQTCFLIEDGFHRRMLKGMQVGLSYKLLAIAKV